MGSGKSQQRWREHGLCRPCGPRRLHVLRLGSWRIGAQTRIGRPASEWLAGQNFSPHRQRPKMHVIRKILAPKHVCRAPPARLRAHMLGDSACLPACSGPLSGGFDQSRPDNARGEGCENMLEQCSPDCSMPDGPPDRTCEFTQKARGNYTCEVIPKLSNFAISVWQAVRRRTI